jgi:hypothetical protein
LHPIETTFRTPPWQSTLAPLGDSGKLDYLKTVRKGTKGTKLNDNEFNFAILEITFEQIMDGKFAEIIREMIPHIEVMGKVEMDS